MMVERRRSPARPHGRITGVAVSADDRNVDRSHHVGRVHHRGSTRSSDHLLEIAVTIATTPHDGGPRRQISAIANIQAQRCLPDIQCPCALAVGHRRRSSAGTDPRTAHVPAPPAWAREAIVRPSYSGHLFNETLYQADHIHPAPQARPDGYLSKWRWFAVTLSCLFSGHTVR